MKLLKNILRLMDNLVSIMQLLLIVVCSLAVIGAAFLAVPFIFLFSSRTDMNELEYDRMGDAAADMQSG